MATLLPVGHVLHRPRLSTIRRPPDLPSTRRRHRALRADELMNTRGVYYRMVLRQMQSAAETGAEMWK